MACGDFNMEELPNSGLSRGKSGKFLKQHCIMQQVPYIIHQTHETREVVNGSPVLRSARQSWLDYLARVSGGRGRYVFWTAMERDSFMKKACPDIYDIWTALPLAVMKVDVWRFAVLLEHGGIYADIDLVMKDNGPNLFGPCELLCGTENAVHFCNWMLAAPKGTSLMAHVLGSLKANLLAAHPVNALSFAKDEHAVHTITGPGAFTVAIRQWLDNKGIKLPSNLSPGGAALGGLQVMPRQALQGGFAQHLFLGGRPGGWVGQRDRLVMEGMEQVMVDTSKAGEGIKLEEERMEQERLEEERLEEERLEKERLEKERLEEERLEKERLEEERLEKERLEEERLEEERLEKERLEEERLEKERLEEERLEEERLENDRLAKERLEKERLAAEMQHLADEKNTLTQLLAEKQLADEKNTLTQLLAEKQLEDEKNALAQLLAAKELQLADSSAKIEEAQRAVVSHAEGLADDTKKQMEMALSVMAREVKCSAEETVRSLVDPLDEKVRRTADDVTTTKALANENNYRLRRVDSKFPGDAGQSIITRLEAMHVTLASVADRLDATQKRLESMERTRLLEAQGAVATGIIDDEEFVLVYVGPSSVSKVVLAHIRECEEGEYRITPEMQVGGVTHGDITFRCNVTEVDIVVQRMDGDEGWISDLRFFLPRPEGGHKRLQQARCTEGASSGRVEDVTLAVEELRSVEEESLPVGEEIVSAEKEGAKVEEPSLSSEEESLPIEEAVVSTGEGKSPAEEESLSVIAINDSAEEGNIVKESTEDTGSLEAGDEPVDAPGEMSAPAIEVGNARPNDITAGGELIKKRKKKKKKKKKPCVQQMMT